MTPANTPSDRFPDGIVWHNFYNHPQVDIALAHITTSLGVEPRPSPLAAAQQTLAGKQILLLLDGTEEADNLPLALGIVDNCGVIVTSRKKGDAGNIRHDIAPLELGEAVDLLRLWGKSQTDDKQTAEQICKLVGRLPLAVRLVGRYLEQTGERAKQYLDWLQETPLTALDSDSEQRSLESVPWLLKRSLAQVSEAAQRVVGLIIKGEGISLGNLGLTYHNLGQVDKAIEYQEQALIISREIGDRRDEGSDLGNLGLA